MISTLSRDEISGWLRAFLANRVLASRVVSTGLRVRGLRALGVRVNSATIHPKVTFLSFNVSIGRGARVERGVVFRGSAHIAIGDGAIVHRSVLDTGTVLATGVQLHVAITVEPGAVVAPARRISGGDVVRYGEK